MPRVEGFVIVSSDGMIADASGKMPAAISNGADQAFFQSGLDHAAVVVHGRHSHEGGAHAGQRKRLVLTRQTAAALTPDSSYPHAWLWNPAATPLEKALEAIGAAEGPVAVIGGTEVFSMFLPFYDAFHLSRAARAKIPGGRPVFSAVGPHVTPEDVLARQGLKPGTRRELDANAGVSVTTWER